MESNTQKYIQFFENLMSPNKETRTQAEKDLDQIKQQPFEATYPIFQAGITSSNQTLSQLATLMFKKVYLDTSELRSKLTPEQINQMKSFILSQISFDKEWKSLKRLGETLALIYQISDIKAAFSEIMTLFGKTEFLARKLAMFILSNLADLGVINEEMIQSNSNDFKTIYKKCLTEDNNKEVKTSAIISFNRFLVNIKSENVQNLFTDMIEDLFSCILSLFQVQNPDDLEVDKEIFDSLIFLVDSYPKFFKEKIDFIIEIICKISGEKKIEFNIRSQCLEVIYSLSNSIPAKIRTSKKFVEIFIPLAFDLLLELDNIEDKQINLWEKLRTEDENDMEYMFYSVKEGLQRLCISLGGIFFMNNTTAFIKKFLGSQNWVEIHGGFAVLATIAEGCKEVFKSNLKDLLQYISQGLVHPHPRVRYISLIFFGNLLRETAPKPQKEYTNNILPGLAKLLTDNEKSLRVKTEACFALNEFLSGLITTNQRTNDNISILSPYINELVELITNVFEHSLSISYEPLQKTSLDCLSLLANLYEKHFAPYYAKIMPGLKKLYFQLDTKTEQQKQLKAHCIDTISYLFGSISENYNENKQDFIEMSQAFISNMETLSEEDPQLNSLINAFTQISLAIQFPDFEPIFKKLFTYLEKFISADIGLTFKDAEEDEYIPDENKSNSTIGSAIFNFGVHSKKISVKTFTLQLKILGIESLNIIALNLESNFKPYINKYLEITKPLLGFAYSRKIRKTAFKSIYTSILACTKDEERQNVFDTMIEDLLNILTFDVKNKFFKDIKCILKYLAKSVNEFEEKITLDKTRKEKIFDLLKDILIITQEKINSIYNINKNDKDGIYDETDKSDQNTDIYNLQKIYANINKLYSGIFKVTPEGGEAEEMESLVEKNLAEFYYQLWESEIKNCLELLNQGKKEEKEFLKTHENCVALCVEFFNYFMENSKIDTFHKMVDKFIENSTKIESNEKVLQMVINGYGIICKKEEKNIFNAKYNQGILTFIQKILGRNKNEDNLFTYDKAINALGKFVYYQCEANDLGYKFAAEFMKLLPAVNDLEESDRICSEFFDQISESSNPLLIGECNKGIAKEAVLRIMDLNTKEDFIDDVTKLIVVSMTLGIANNKLVDN